MLGVTDKDWRRKALGGVVLLYVPFLLCLSMLTGHLQQLGHPSLFFSSTDSQGYKLIADYYASLGQSERPDDFLLSLRPFLFPLYLTLYKMIGITGVQTLQIMMNIASLWMVLLAIKALSNRSWIAVVGTTVLAVTPSFNFLAFHGLTESLSIFLVCLFMLLMIQYFARQAQSQLFLAGLTVSALLCIRPIVLPFWVLFMGYYFVRVLSEHSWKVWRPIVCTAPVISQLIISLILTGSPTLSASGRANISEWFFPAVYGEKEYGKWIHRKSEEAREGLRRFPELRDRVGYLIKNYREAIKTYFHILVIHNLIAGSHFVRSYSQPEATDDIVVRVLQKASMYLNRIFVCVHAIMAALLIWLVASGKKWNDQKAMLVCYLFAILLILPTGLAYFQGDRYMLAAEPLWLVAYSALIGLFLDSLKTNFAPLRIKTPSLDVIR